MAHAGQGAATVAPCLVAIILVSTAGPAGFIIHPHGPPCRMSE